MSKPVTSRGWVRAVCVVPVLAVVAVALLALSPALHRGKASTAAAGSVASQTIASQTIASQTSADTAAARGRIQSRYAALPLAFEPNQGQTDASVKYMAHGNGYTLFLTATDAVFSLHSLSGQTRPAQTQPAQNALAKRLQLRAARTGSTAVVRMQLEDANSQAQVAASGLLPGKSNYFLGSDSGKWRNDVARYARVSYRDVYPGVNLAYYGAQSQLEFDFVVAPGANPAPIGLHFTGARGLKTDGSGNLIIASAAGDVLLRKPVAYQEQNGARQSVDARFALKANNQISFELGHYDRSRELVIDPTISYEYSTYLGGNGNDSGYGIAFDGSGNAYVTGQTASTNFPGALNSFVGTANVFVTKFSATGSSLVYSTYVGGNGSPFGDSGNAIAVDASGDAFVAGGTDSANFPKTSGAFQTSLAGTENAFVFELGPSGAIVYSTYLGGTSADIGVGVALSSDSSGDVYVVGRTSSTDFPTASPLQSSLSGTSSAFVTKLNSSGTALAYSTYLGGSTTGDEATAVAVDSSNNAYVTGQTFSATFPTSTGAVQTTCGSCTNGNGNAFVTVINPGGTAYIYSTFLGGSGDDIGDGIAVDSADSAYVTGETTSSQFPTTTGAFQTTYGGNGDAFVSKLNPAGSALAYSTYLGGSQGDAGVGIAVDGYSNAYVTGETFSSTNFPVVNATQATFGGGDTDAFVSGVNSTGSALAFSTYLGGAGDENSGSQGGIAVDSPGANIYVTGTTTPPTTPPGPNNFPVNSAEQSTPGGGSDAFVAKYSQVTFNLAATSPTAVSAGTAGASTVTLTAVNGYSSSVTLNCSVTGTGSPLPSCSASSFTPGSVTPTGAGATSALSITTTAPTSAMLVPGKIFYAMWLPVAGMSLMGAGFGSSRSRRKKMLGFLMIGMVMAALFLMPACGSSSSSGGGGGGGTTGTPAGNYNVTITGTGADGTIQSTQVTLTVNAS